MQIGPPQQGDSVKNFEPAAKKPKMDLRSHALKTVREPALVYRVSIAPKVQETQFSVASSVACCRALLDANKSVNVLSVLQEVAERDVHEWLDEFCYQLATKDIETQKKVWANMAAASNVPQERLFAAAKKQDDEALLEMLPKGNVLAEYALTHILMRSS